ALTTPMTMAKPLIAIALGVVVKSPSCSAGSRSCMTASAPRIGDAILSSGSRPRSAPAWLSSCDLMSRARKEHRRMLRRGFQAVHEVRQARGELLSAQARYTVDAPDQAVLGGQRCPRGADSSSRRETQLEPSRIGRRLAAADEPLLDQPRY